MSVNQVLSFTIVLVATVASAQVGPVGTEFQVNTYTTGSQYQAGRAICHAGDGDFVIVWQSGSIEEAIDQDGDASGIFAQRYASSGAPVGTEFQVNTYTSSYQTDPAVCCQSDGDFVVTWSSDFFSGGANTGQRAIRGQRFASAGGPIGTEFAVNNFTANSFNSDICCDAAGGFVVVWVEFSDSINVWARRFDSAGAAQGGEFQVNTYTPALTPGVCCSAAGDFVVAWTQFLLPLSDVFGRRFASDGTPQGTEFQVNTFTGGFQGQYPNGGSSENQAICCDQSGNFTIAWTSLASLASNNDVHGQQFASDGSFKGDEFQVNAYTSGSQSSPAICCGPNGQFVVVWTGQVAPMSDTNFIFGRRFASSTVPLSGDFQVNTYTSGFMGYPAVSCGPDASFVVSWTQFPNEDGDRGGVFAQRFAALGLVPTPTLTWLGFGSAVVALLAVARAAFRRRR